MLQPGTTIDGRYEVEALVGEGGLACVYRVRHVDLGSVHALKVLMWRRKSLAERLVLEGRIQAQLRHPNVVAVTDLVRMDGQLGLLMEYIDHETLERYLERQGALPVDEALTLMAPVMAGVTAAHDAGVLHRDLKPANILLTRSTRGVVPKVADFGIAKVVADEVSRTGSTAAGVTMGTPGYLAPEQVLDSADTDARADVFALGAIVYECIAGRRAFADEGGGIGVRSTVERVPAPLGPLGLADEPVSAAIARALARERDDRFPDVRSFARALYAERPELLAQVEGQQIAGPLSLEVQRSTLDSLSGRPPGPPTPPALGATADPAPGAAPRPGAAPTFEEEPRTEEEPPPAEDARPPDEPRSAPRRSAAPALGAAIGGLVMLGFVALGAVLLGGLVLWTNLDAYRDASATAAPQLDEAPASRAPAPEVSADPAPSHDAPDDAGTDATAAGAESPDDTPADTEGTAPDAPPADPGAAEAAIAAPAPSPRPAAAAPPDLVGTWEGTANGRPFRLEIASLTDGAVSGRAVFQLGPTERNSPVRGTLDPATGAITLDEGGAGFAYRGTLADSTITGTYGKAGAGPTLDFTVTRR